MDRKSAPKPPPQPDKSVPAPEVSWVNPGAKPELPEHPTPRVVGGFQPGKYTRRCPPPPGPRLVRKERVTYHIRFRRGWFARLVIQVELAVHWYEWDKQDQQSVKSAMEWRDATKHELEEIARGYFEPESHRNGAKK